MFESLQHLKQYIGCNGHLLMQLVCGRLVWTIGVVLAVLQTSCSAYMLARGRFHSLCKTPLSIVHSIAASKPNAARS